MAWHFPVMLDPIMSLLASLGIHSFPTSILVSAADNIFVRFS
jgi:hypothetical protein